MGVVNVTPDSFYAASRSPAVAASIDAGRRMIGEGADVLDVGGESTRPGAVPVSAETETARVLPVVRALHESYPHTAISIDTYKAAVAWRAVRAGAVIVNDVSAGLLDDEMPRAVAETDATVILGHLRGTPATMRNAHHYHDVLAEVVGELAGRVEVFRRAGVAAERIWVDTGFGFGKGAAASRALLFGLRALGSLGRPVVVGVSRKSFLGRALRQAGLGETSPEDRLEASLAAAVLAAERGAALVRTHDVGATRRALAVLEEAEG